jgi:biotin transport system substrate-specific component
MLQSITPTHTLPLERTGWRILAQILCGSLFLALCAQIAIFLPFSPIPITMQTFGVMLLGCLLGSKKAAAAVVLYLLEGTLGLPVFAGGVINTLALMGPPAGYLVGMVAQAYLSGLLKDKKITATSLKGISLLLFASLVQLSIGTLVLAPFVGSNYALALGFTPFIIGGILKVAAIVALEKSR